ncbi:MAG: tetratricopeptide repeat protein [Cyanobacteria bacterium RUI128]|nr:tetratricopeptide repeat protein [Cyanobacteria bacterium RUI128]
MDGLREEFNSAFNLHKEGKLDEAESGYRELIEKGYKVAEMWNLTGMIYMQRFQLSKAEEYILKAIELEPNPYFFENLAKVYLEKEDSEQAIKLYNELVKTNPDNFDYLFNLASAYKLAGNIDKAAETYIRASEVCPDNPDTFFNLGLIYDNEGQPDNSIKYYKEALKLRPDDMETRYFTGLAYFKNRDYKNGLPYFENRLCKQSALVTQLNTYPNLVRKAPVWEGEDISDKTLYTYYEAGFGDILMFARYLPMLRERCKKLIFKPQAPLVELFEYNFPDIDFQKYFVNEHEMDFDYHIPILSVPYVLGLDETNGMFTGKSGYLKADPEIVKRYKIDYFNNTKFKIGIKWRGNTHYEMDRVIDVKSFTKLFDIPNTQFYSFQTFEGSEDLNEIINDYNIVDIGSTVENFADTAGALENMDLIICNDTSLVHLAGAMSKPCWVLLPYLYNWRWHLDINKCDWYDTVKLYRQKEVGNWDEIFDRMYADLKQIV